MQKQQELLEQQKLKMQEQHRMEKEIMENERLEQIKNKKDGEQSEWLLLWPLTFGVKGQGQGPPPLFVPCEDNIRIVLQFCKIKMHFDFKMSLESRGGGGVMIVKF